MSYRGAPPPRRTAPTPIAELPELTLGPGDRLVILSTNQASRGLVDWLSSTYPPWRIVAIRRRQTFVEVGRWPFRRTVPTDRTVPPDANDLAAGLRALDERQGEVLLVEDPPLPLLREILSAQDRTGVALVLVTNETEIARRAGGALLLARLNGLQLTTLDEVVAVEPPPDPDWARLAGWSYFWAQIINDDAREPGPVEIVPGHRLAVRWHAIVTCVDAIDRASQSYQWSASWMLPGDRYILDPPTVPAGWSAVEGRVSSVDAMTGEVLVRAAGWTFRFLLDGALPGEGAIARVALDPSAARVF